MTGLPRSILERLRAKARLEAESASTSAPFAATPLQNLEWLGSATLRAPAPGHVDIVISRRR